MDSDDDMYECYSDNDVGSGSYDDGGGDYDDDAVDYAENDDSDDLPSYRELEKVSENLSIPEPQLKFVIEAWEQIVECRSVLRWIYAYGYYIPEQENAKRQLFGYLQGEAESGLEWLHACAEKELQVYFDAESPSGDSEEFIAFRCKLAGLTWYLTT